jgi:methionyl-tRNA formyltransferase
MQRLKIIFAATPEIALLSLQSLENSPDFEICAVFTQPDKPANRGKITPPPVKVFAEEKGIRVYQPEKFAAAEVEIIRKYNPDFLVVVAYGLILPKEILTIPKHGCINLHGSLLPKYRGASPIQSAILAGDEISGVSFMQIEEELDSGGVYAAFTTPIAKKTSAELSADLADLGGKYFPKVLREIAEGKLTPTPQDSAAATFTKKIRKEDGKIDFTTEDAESILRKLRAFTPWPGIFTAYKGKILKILAARIEKNSSKSQIGEVIPIGNSVGIQTREGVLILEKIQLEGKKPLGIQDFICGEKDFIHTILN